jgi:hypothetical protein
VTSVQGALEDSDVCHIVELSIVLTKQFQDQYRGPDLSVASPGPWLHLEIMLALSPTVLAGLAIVFVVGHVLVTYFRNPLRRIPAAHPLAPFTSLWIHSVRWRAIENATLKDAHDRLGPIVCLGPNDVSVNCVQGGIRDIYAGGFEKGSCRDDGYNWYAFFVNYGG